jgi:ribokinase
LFSITISFILDLEIKTEFMSRIIVVGSSNTDMVIKSKKLPLPGETILGGAFLMNPGGKGANQAVAAARLGGNVTFVAKIGNDVFGEEALKGFNEARIDTRYIVKDPISPSGVALINVDEDGENSIVVASGANGTLVSGDIRNEVFETEKQDIYLMQLEIPLETVRYVADKACRMGNRVILNPAPACWLSESLYKCLYLITPNETEAGILTGIEVFDEASAEEAALQLRSKGVQHVVITMGGTGAYILSGSISMLVPGIQVKAVDTTAAGDIFSGALAVAISEGMDIVSAVTFANKAASISVTRMGAQVSAPFRNEVK